MSKLDPDKKPFYQRVEQFLTTYYLNDAGLSYASQGYTIGDGVTLTSYIVSYHLKVLSLMRKYEKKHAKSRKKGG